MKRNHAVLAGPLILALAGLFFCVWSAFGNDVNFCVTTGCTLYQDFSIGGISLWWFGTGAFAILAACAILGQIRPGRWLAGLFVFGDIFLLALLAFTAPCISCMVVAALFALCYWWFRRSENLPLRPGQPVVKRHSVLLWIWLALFVINIGLVARSQLDIWAILDESQDPRIRMFFSPSCTYCVEGINVLSGNVNVAFYPIAENDADVYRLAKMEQLLNEGMSLAEALGKSVDEAPHGFFSAFRPDILLLRFRLLRNKAHIFQAGSQAVPFFETRGLPADIAAKARERHTPRASAKEAPAASSQPDEGSPKDHALPYELEPSGQCGPGVDCPPAS